MGGGRLPLCLVVAALAAPAAASTPTSTGPSVHLPLSGCEATPVGCWSDCGGGVSKRTLPIGVSGCCNTDQDPPGGCPACHTACVNAAEKAANKDFLTDVCPAAGHTCPVCTGATLTGQRCADYCAQMNPDFQFAGVEFGIQCFCGCVLIPHIPHPWVFPRWAPDCLGAESGL